MTEHASNRFWAGIDITQTLAGVLAAVSAAVVGSFLGVAGTLVGAAVASIVGSVGTEVYHRWIDRGGRRIRATFVTAPAAVGTPEVVAAADETPSQAEPAEPAESAIPRRIRWGRVIAVAATLFVLAVGVLTAFELITRHSVADAVGNDSSRSTTICSALCGGSADDSTPAPAGSSSPATSPTPSGTTVEPSPEASEPGAPTSPSATTEAPAPATTTPLPAGTPTTVAPEGLRTQGPGTE